MPISKQRGLTLIELMVTVVVLAILATAATPSIQAMIENNQLRATTNDLTASLYMARSEAAKRNFNVVVCASNATQTDCDTSVSDYRNGWIIFTDYSQDRLLTPTTTFDTDGDGTPDTAEEILFIGAKPRDTLHISGNNTNATRISYSPTGRTSPSQFSLIIRDGDANGDELSRITFGLTGRLRTCFVSATTSCSS